MIGRLNRNWNKLELQDRPRGFYRVQQIFKIFGHVRLTVYLKIKLSAYCKKKAYYIHGGSIEALGSIQAFSTSASQLHFLV